MAVSDVSDTFFAWRLNIKTPSQGSISAGKLGLCHRGRARRGGRVPLVSLVGRVPACSRREWQVRVDQEESFWDQSLFSPDGL